MDDENRTDTDRQPAARDDVAPLFQIAGPRPRLPENEVAPLRAQAREVFRRQARRTVRRRRIGWAVGAGLAAAGLLLIAGPAVRRLSLPGASEPIATFEMRTGDVRVSGGPSDSPTLLPGTVVTTGRGGRAALRLPAGASLRIDGGSTVRFDSTRTLTLERGAVYTDSGSPAKLAEGIEIATTFGSVRDVGTQFEVRLLPGAKALRVRVREGKVLVDQAGEIRQAGAGAELVLHADGSLRRADVPVYGPGWDWVQRIAPSLAIENASLADFLHWVSRETGLRWHLAEPDTDPGPEHVILHGSIEGLTVEEALAVVLPGCGYRHRRVGGELWLEKTEGAGRTSPP
jgi:ferric-dicitrate binding protein FerR (iron transport regulator)